MLLLQMASTTVAFVSFHRYELSFSLLFDDLVLTNLCPVNASNLLERLPANPSNLKHWSVLCLGRQLPNRSKAFETDIIALEQLSPEPKNAFSGMLDLSVTSPIQQGEFTCS